MPDVDASFRRVWFGMIAMTLIVMGGTAGYMALGLGFLDALYQTVTAVTTVGFREVGEFGAGEKVFTIALLVVGVGTALYTFGVLIEALVEGHFSDLVATRRMHRRINAMENHVIICGWGRVGRAIARSVENAGVDVIIVDRDPHRLLQAPHPTVEGDISDDEVLRKAGIERAKVLVAALNTDADNLYVTVSGRALRPDLFIIARARNESSEVKLARAGADRVVNPQRIGGERMAAFAVQPHVAEFLDVVMHEENLEFHLEEFTVPAASPLAGQSLRETHIRDRTGALVLAVRQPSDGTFATNPAPETVIEPGSVLIAIGTTDQLSALSTLAGA